MTSDELKKLPLGAKVTYHSIARNVTTGNLVFVRTVEKFAIARPVSGIYIGYRHIPVGTIKWRYEDGTIFSQKGVALVALVVSGVRRSPVRVLPEDLDL